MALSILLSFTSLMRGEQQQQEVYHEQDYEGEDPGEKDAGEEEGLSSDDDSTLSPTTKTADPEEQMVGPAGILLSLTKGEEVTTSKNMSALLMYGGSGGSPSSPGEQSPIITLTKVITC